MWAKPCSLTATHKEFKKVLVEDGSTLVIWLTRGGLRWSKTGEYKGKKPHYKRGSDNLKRKNHCILKNYNSV